MTDETDTDEKSMSRRSVLSGAGVVAGGWLVNKLTGGAVSVAKAQQSQEYRIEFAPDDVTEYAIDDEVQGDGTTDLIIKHVPSDTTVRWDRSEGSFDFSEIRDLIADRITATDVTTGTATVNNGLSAGSVRTGEETITGVDGTLYDEQVKKTESGGRTVISQNSNYFPGVAGDISGKEIVEGIHGNLTIVMGVDSDKTPTETFTDLILWTALGTVSVIGSTERETPPSRSYNESINSLSLTLSGGSSADWDITVETIQLSA